MIGLHTATAMTSGSVRAFQCKTILRQVVGSDAMVEMVMNVVMAITTATATTNDSLWTFFCRYGKASGSKAMIMGITMAMIMAVVMTSRSIAALR